MNVRGLLIAVVILAALGGGVYWSNKTKEAEKDTLSPDAPPKILTIPEDQIRQIEIRKAGAEPTVLRKADDGKWQMSSPELPVDQDAVSGLVSTLSSLDSGRLVEEKTADVATFGLASPALEVSVTGKDGKVHKVLVGDESPAGSGFFAKLDADPRIFTIASYNKTNLDKSPADLRDKRLLTFDPDKITRVELAAKGQSIEFGKNAQNEWQIIRPKPMRADGGQVEEIIRRLKDARMDTFGAGEDPKKTASAFASGTRVAVAKVTDAAGTQEIEVRKDKNFDFYARSSVVEGFHKITSYVGEGLDKGLDDFRNKKLFDFGWSDPGKIEIRDGDKRVTYAKSEDKWMSGSQQMDSASVQAVVDKLRGLSAAGFPERGFTSPVIEATVTSDEGKRAEKVLISQSGNSYLAKRENEPAIYELEAKTVEELRKAVADVKEHQPPKDDKKK